MRLAEEILSQLENLSNAGEEEDRALWSEFSLSQAARDMEDEEEIYSTEDLVGAF